VRFSGLLMFAGNLTTLATGLVFNVLIARNLEPAELGVWFFIGSVIPYFQVLEKVVPYWSVVEISRGHAVGRTAVVFNLLLSLPIASAFALLSGVLADTIGTEQRTVALAALLLPLYYVIAALTSATYSTEPHRLGMRTLVIDGVKIPLALAFLPMGLEGVIVAVVIANAAYAVYLYSVSRKYFEDDLDQEWLKGSLRRAWLPLHENFVGYLTAATDSVIIGVLLSSDDLSRYGIGLAIAGVVGTAKALTSAVFPALLRSGTAGPAELRALFKFLHVFTTPMVAGGIALAPQLVEIFGTRYLAAAPALPYLLLTPAIGVMSLTMKGIVTGLETVERGTAGRSLVRSALFVTQLPNYLYLGTLVLGTVVAVGWAGITGAAMARLAASVASFVPMLYLYGKRAPAITVLYGLEKTVPATLVMVAVLFLINPRGTLLTLGTVAVGALVYFSVLLLIDRDSRALTRRAIGEARRAILSTEE
ncbi:MAG: oligosaccharide flippase family protein, partial [Thaumarchaeota archaeon]|nr:oligosaccharide flippase family protein [Candidatus Calditenuaceae archaeon]MDW8187256.1 oligosaccharide flippase family protein [Nitrososphaerota archaeon]